MALYPVAIQPKEDALIQQRKPIGRLLAQGRQVASAIDREYRFRPEVGRRRRDAREPFALLRPESGLGEEWRRCSTGQGVAQNPNWQNRRN
jgi:hypothetical protein